MERYYDGDQEALFKAAHVINPYMKPKTQPKVSQNSYNSYFIMIFVLHQYICVSVCVALGGIWNIHNFLTQNNIKKQQTHLYY